MPHLDSYAAIVEHYQWGDRLKTIDELSYFENLRTIEEAIESVPEARKENGALHNHQRHLKESTVDEVRQELREHQKAIKAVANFEELFALFERILLPIRGVGEMYVYDTALRMGAFLRKLPDQIYLHKGTREGVMALGISVEERKSVDVSELPTPFQVLKPHEIEDVLCIYKIEINRIHRKLALGR